MINLTFHNGTRAIMLGVPKDARKINLYQPYISPNRYLKRIEWENGTLSPFNSKDVGYDEYEIIGEFTPPSELSFEVKEEWVKIKAECEVQGEWMRTYEEYELLEDYFCVTKEESFISYLLSCIKQSGEEFEKYVIIKIKP